MGLIHVTGIKVYAYHGCLDEEARIGSDYQVDIELHTDFSVAAETDDLTLTIDYVTVNTVVKEEMAIRSKLIEHAGKRILDRLHADCPRLDRAVVTVAKMNPPINGNVTSVSVTLSS